MRSEQAPIGTTADTAKVFESRGLNGQEQKVEAIKAKAAELLLEIATVVTTPGNNECGRYIALAKTSLEESVMWAVKAVSRSH